MPLEKKNTKETKIGDWVFIKPLHVQLCYLRSCITPPPPHTHTPTPTQPPTPHPLHPH